MEKQLLSALVLTLIATSGLLYNYTQTNEQNDDIRTIYEQWKQKQNRRYGNSEDNYRFEIFSQNHKFMVSHNELYEQGLETIILGHNQFSDMTNEEFSAKYLTRPHSASPAPKPENKMFKIPNAPSSVDHRESGIVGEVVNQGSCGSCWAFSAAGSVQSALRQNGLKDFNTSQQEIIDCVVGEDYQSYGCDGGFSRDGIVYVSRHGITSAEQYPYAGKQGECQREKHQKIRHFVKGYIHIKQNDASDFVEGIAIRPLSAAINAGGIWFQMYSGGIFSRSCAGGWDDLNHEIVVVGYAPEYYIIKNSWGASWGEQGYIRFARIAAKEGQCGVQQDPGYPEI